MFRFGRLSQRLPLGHEIIDFWKSDCGGSSLSLLYVPADMDKDKVTFYNAPHSSLSTR